MARKAARFLHSEAVRLMRAAVDAGCKPTGFELTPEGALRVVFTPIETARTNSFDQIMGLE